MPRRGENIFKRKDGRWEARYVKEVTLNGSKKYGSVYAKSYREVKAKQQFYINQPLGGTRKTAATVDDAMNEWLAESKNQIKISSFQKYRSTVQNHISKQIGTIRLDNLTALTVAQFTDYLLTEEKLSRETVNNILIILGMGLEFAKTHYNVAVPDIHLFKIQKSKTRVLTEYEQQILLRFLLSQEDMFSFGTLLALYTGLRVGEICALKWEDFCGNTIHINKTMQRLKNTSGKTEVMILPPKTTSSDRIIPIPAVLQPIIEKNRKESGYVLTQKSGRFIEPRLLQNRFEKYMETCGLNGVHFHTLRHTFATRCIETGMDAKTLSELLGHSDVKTTLNRYVHSSPELKQKGVDKLTFSI